MHDNWRRLRDRISLDFEVKQSLGFKNFYETEPKWARAFHNLERSDKSDVLTEASLWLPKHFVASAWSTLGTVFGAIRCTDAGCQTFAETNSSYLKNTSRNNILQIQVKDIFRATTGLNIRASSYVGLNNSGSGWAWASHTWILSPSSLNFFSAFIKLLIQQKLLICSVY